MSNILEHILVLLFIDETRWKSSRFIGKSKGNRDILLHLSMNLVGTIWSFSIKYERYPSTNEKKTNKPERDEEMKRKEKRKCDQWIFSSADEWTDK